MSVARMELHFVRHKNAYIDLRTYRENNVIKYCNVLGDSIHDGTLLHSKKSIHYS
jgi:hypothetical protein